jgi:hypothetical protein
MQTEIERIKAKEVQTEHQISGTPLKEKIYKLWA